MPNALIYYIIHLTNKDSLGHNGTFSLRSDGESYSSSLSPFKFDVVLELILFSSLMYTDELCNV